VGATVDSNNLMVACDRYTFQVSQGSVETDIVQVRWKMFTQFYSKFIQETVYQISSESPKCYGRYYKIHFGLIFHRTHHRNMTFRVFRQA